MTAPHILALDVSKTRTGVAEGAVGSVPRAYSIVGQGSDDVGAMMNLGHWLLDKIKADRPDWIFFEAALDAGAFQPIVDWEGRTTRSQRDPPTTVILAKRVGIVEFIAGMKSIPARPVNARTARVSFFGKGNGNLKREEAKARALETCRLLGWPAANDDEADAMGIWHHACTVVKPDDAAIITPMMNLKAATQASVVLAERERKRKARNRQTAPAEGPKAADVFGQSPLKIKPQRGWTSRGRRR